SAAAPAANTADATATGAPSLVARAVDPDLVPHDQNEPTFMEAEKPPAAEPAPAVAHAAGFIPAPAYLKGAIDAATDHPDARAYLGHLSAREAPRGANDVSPTGAAGPYQFTRGTARQYGLIDAQGNDLRTDPVASTKAALQLTKDNAKVFEQMVGRPPTFNELALMHQQGGVTGARMVLGTGNAPAYNLQVNNMGGMSPQQAVARAKTFYGMPDTGIGRADGAPIDWRNVAAKQLAARGGPQPNPTLSGAPEAPGGQIPDQRLAMAHT